MATAKTQETQAPAETLAENTVVDETASLAVRRYFTIPGRDPFDEIEWEIRDAFIPGKEKPVFDQKEVEFPKFWSQTATNIVAQKYFRGRMTSPERERSVKQMIGRVVDTISGWGRADGYFATDEEADTFEAELKAILVNQLASFNSPVWFNVGFEEKPQCSACFILSIDDSMDSILDWIRREGVIFRGGSGSGVNLSKLRSSKEQLSKGGYASGPVSFMRGADASAGTIKSGGKTRRAAKMVVLDVDHLRRAPRLAAGLDRPGRRVCAAHEGDRPGGVAALRELLLRGAKLERLTPEPRPRKMTPSRRDPSRSSHRVVDGEVEQPSIAASPQSRR